MYEEQAEQLPRPHGPHEARVYHVDFGVDHLETAYTATPEDVVVEAAPIYNDEYALSVAHQDQVADLRTAMIRRDIDRIHAAAEQGEVHGYHQKAA